MNRGAAILYASGAAYLGESFVFIFRPTALSTSLVRLTYPPFSALASYCSAQGCLYSAAEVATLYTVQLITFCISSLIILAISSRCKPVPKDRVVVLFCILLIGGVASDYVRGNFAFHPIWILPNSVASSPIGLLRFALLFWLGTLAVLLLSNIQKSKESPNGRFS